MIDDKPSSRDAVTGSDTAKTQLEHAQPYRAPVNVGESSAPPEPRRSALVWGFVLAGGLAVAAGGYYATKPVIDFNGSRRPVEPLDLEMAVEEFGLYRSGPIEEPDGSNAGEMGVGEVDVQANPSADPATEPVLP